MYIWMSFICLESIYFVEEMNQWHTIFETKKKKKKIRRENNNTTTTAITTIIKQIFILIENHDKIKYNNKNKGKGKKKHINKYSQIWQNKLTNYLTELS